MSPENVNLKLTLAYDGERYFGFQKTKEGPSIEEELEKVLKTILQEKIILQAASRTDRGVHALQQVVNVKLTKKPKDLKRLLISINKMLPKDIALLEIEEEHPDFHPTLDVKTKEYTYDVYLGAIMLPFQRKTAWHVPQELDIALMKKGAKLLTGTHDFASFTNQKKNEIYETTIRTIDKINVVKINDNHLRFTVTGKSFLYKMVRNIVGTLIYVGLGKISLSQLEKILQGKDRKQAGVTAPAHGLTLSSITYK